MVIISATTHLFYYLFSWKLNNLLDLKIELAMTILPKYKELSYNPRGYWSLRRKNLNLDFSTLILMFLLTTCCYLCCWCCCRSFAVISFKDSPIWFIIFNDILLIKTKMNILIRIHIVWIIITPNQLLSHY